ncbi:MAG TPA: hypothetical protein RMH26_17685 [Polyangiaceae bacterium LLY-WYZ-15_(1-7)]|nr:hypothetical protein [Polyangiaceae bacterium LLY-WYZ-15_(1-7)]HJL25550.1 hypothetical protein [Polyangiaceae bacterium LLY-WYZ-15_(1-7)]
MVAHGAAPDGLSQRAPQQVTGARTTRDAVGCSSPALVDALPIVHEGRIDLGLRLGCAGASDVRYARDDFGRLSADLDRDGDLVEGRAVCVPAHTGSGCAAGGTSSPSAGLAWMCLALGLARRRWRKR